MRTLRRGDSGDAVTAIQRILQEEGLFHAALGNRFGPRTEEAVFAFQRLHNGPGGRRLASNGVVADATWWAMRHLEKSRATVPALRFGDSGDDVKVLQRLLKQQGVFTGAVRGNFRSLTEAAVTAFQRTHVGSRGAALQVDGVVGRQTWWALLRPATARTGGRGNRTTLTIGDSGPDVAEVQQILKNQGAFRGAVKGNFGKLTYAAVRYFQETHLGPDGRFLVVDGEVGPATWFALRHPSGPPQSSALRWDIPAGIGDLRTHQLEIVVRERQANVRERPDGANWGGGIEKYRGAKGAPWCCYFWSWGTKEAMGSYPLGAKLGRCLTAWNRAKARGMAHHKGGYLPIPGDAFVMLYRESGVLTGRGHIGFVLRVEVVDGLATAIDTVEGNAGNRVKVGHRLLSASSIVGFINPYPRRSQPTGWQTGLGKTDLGGRSTTR